ncbi:Uncharacterised protein [Rikenella microfusus]|uniref:Ephrin RBD domain-containing protein n=1 Tax=Rikenella microfusus TaxID=28139 RepID=A0A379MRH1_9BACT|nr:Uncharacterised protein [Rikenella microfusus]
MPRFTHKFQQFYPVPVGETQVGEDYIVIR